jgi:hypothetical protein
MTAEAIAAPAGTGRLINPWNLWWVAAAFLVMTGAIVSADLWALNFVHVIAGVMWTGIDLFMGFVVGPVMRKLDMPIRRAFTLRLMPRMVFLMPTLSIITGTSGWFLAKQIGYLDVSYPQRWWVVAALVVIGVLTVQGLGILLPTNVRVCLQLQKDKPDVELLGRLMRRYIRSVAIQGTMQMAIIVIMARFVSGL